MNQDPFEKFIKELNDNIKNNYQTVAYAFENEYGCPEVDSVRSEICKCIICGFYQAAITLTNHLLESVLKKALIIYESAKNKMEQSDITNVFDDATKKYGPSDLAFTINQACQKGLITKEEKKILHKFRKQYRNAFSHAEPQKTFTGISIPARIFTTDHLNNPEEFLNSIFADKPNTILSVENCIITQGFMQSIKAEKESLPYFLIVDGIVRNLCSKLF